ncbi:recombinase family protein [Rothia uropygialis]|uniref:recombinase family protein n=1 Tax=Kocuria sp. 36 TaxID=1415402 RepID=UPI00101BF1C9|nr:recombinase family protein [Kocuria sp. 36]
MKIGYARVSTSDQSLRAQTDALEAVGCERIFSDVASGAKAKRPGLDEVITFAREGDVVIVTRLDRLGRTVLDTLATLRELDERGIRVQAQDIDLDTATPAGRLVLTVILALAQWERETILARTREGLDAAKSRGRVGGRKPALSPEQQDSALSALAAGMPVVEVARLLGVSRWTITRLRDRTRAGE